ncbi:MAG: hypothetical protein HY746_03935, partial [Elusimicrobia bacterium]|nr:hypothetical protein [Elusimicrobiota bacterium]
SDMGSWKYFADFVKWSAQTYPAKKHLIILWNHGSGRIDIGGADNTGAELGISYDDITKNFIRNKQLGLALREISAALGKKPEIYSSDACLMQMAAVAYEIKDYADYLVQSEEIVPGAGFPYDTILQAINDNPGAGAEEVSKIIVDKFYDYYQATAKKTTISIIKTSQFPSFISTLNDWVKTASQKSTRKTVLDSIKSAVSFEEEYDGPDTSGNARSKDLYDFINRINLKTDKNSAVYKKGEALKTFIDGTLVIHNKTTNGMDKAKGLAAYFPKMIYDSSYDEMLFARDSLWDDFLKWTLDGNYKVHPVK